MSGQPLRNPSDAEKYRQAYLATLDLQIANNDKNFQANKLHRRTGVVSTQITDYRSTSEKLADVTNLRILLRKYLRQIADAQNAEGIAQSLSADQVQFASQHIEAIIKDLKPNYKFGILREVFIPYLVNYMEKEGINQLLEADIPVTEGYEVEDISEDGVVSLATLQRLFKIVEEMPNNLFTDLKRLKDILYDEIEKCSKLYKTPEIEDALRAVDEDTKERVIRLYNEAQESLPTNAQIDQEIRKLQNENDTTMLEEVLLGIIEYLIQPSVAIDCVRQAEALLTESIESKATYEKATGSKQELLRKGQYAGKPLKEGTILPELPSLTDVTNKREKRGVNKRLYTNPQLMDWLKTYVEAGAIKGIDFNRSYDDDETLDLFTENYRKMEKAFERQQQRIIVPRPYTPYGGFESPLGSQEVEREEEQAGGDGGGGGGGAGAYDIPNRIGAPRSRQTGVGADGRGLRRKVGKGVSVATQTDHTLGVPEKMKYAPLGRYFINLVKLNNDVVSFVKKSGVSVYDLKTQRVSESVAKILRKIVNGGKPSFDDLTALNEADKALLLDIKHKAQVMEDLDVPQPADDRKDINQFEIMKGQLLSGNDSVEMIKAFKRLIVKLTHTGRLPKGQAKELLMSMAELGY